MSYIYTYYLQGTSLRQGKISEVFFIKTLKYIVLQHKA